MEPRPSNALPNRRRLSRLTPSTQPGTNPPVGSTGSPRLRRGVPPLDIGGPPDGATVLTVYMVLLYAVPSDQTVAGLSGAGSPAFLWALGAGLWWTWYHLQRAQSTGVTVLQPVRIAGFLLMGSVLASYVAAGTRALPFTEASTADTGLLRSLAWLGVLLLANDGVPSYDRCLVLIRRLVLAGGLMAVLGLAQFVTGQSLIDGFVLPGFTSSQSFSNVLDRSGFTRSAATAMHPLEYAVVLTMCLPFALTLAFQDRSLSAFRRWAPALVIAVASALSVSRSALLGVLAGILVMMPTWPRRIRLTIAASMVAIGLALYVLVPGLVGTITNLFTGISEDDSAASRANSFDTALLLFDRHPLFGRGMGTLLPQYVIFDNQYLLTLVDSGIVGLLALLGVIVAGIVCARGARRLLTDQFDRQIAQAFVAALVAGGSLLAFFDALSFPKAAGTVFLVAGLAGSVWRLANQQARYPRNEFISIQRGNFL